MKKYDVVVMGLGAMGSSAIFQLSKAGKSVLGIDQYSPPHKIGSSHGETRITRQANGEGAAYTPLALRSHEIWRELEAESGRQLLTVTGGLIISKTGTNSILHGKPNFLQQTIESAEEYGIAHQLLSSSEIRARYPQFNVGDDDGAYFEDGAGFLRPEACIEVFLTLASRQGAEIRLNEKVLRFAPDGDGVRISTETDEILADRLIVTVGPWIGRYLGPEYESLLTVYRQVLYWFEVDDPTRFSPERFPIFIWDLGGADDMYGFPIVDPSQPAIKVAAELYEQPTSPEDVDRVVSDAEKEEMFTRRIDNRIVGAKPNCLKARTCLYTVTPDNNFIIDTLPTSPQIFIASPCSGHGFKHSAAIGEVLAEMADGKQTRFDISSFSLNRFLSNPTGAA